jgi:putative transposase
MAGSLRQIIQAFKSMTTHEYVMGVRQRGWAPFHGRLWQRNYHEHVVRSDDDLRRTREYILGNPARWNEDENNPALVNFVSGNLDNVSLCSKIYCDSSRFYCNGIDRC